MLQALRNLLPNSPQQAREEALVANLIANYHTPVTTPDVLLLEQQPWHYVFLYCNQQTNHPKAVEGAEHLWRGSTEKTFSFWKHDLGKESYPIALNKIPAFSRIPHLPIRGEIVKMPTQKLIQLDLERRNRLYFRRVQTPIRVDCLWPVETKDRARMEEIHGIPHVRGEMYPIPISHTVPAWMYVGVSKYWTETLDGGHIFKHCKVFSPNRAKLNEDQYYYFSPTEYP